MKKLTVLLPDNCPVDVMPLLAVAIDFRFESVDEAPVAVPKKKRRPRVKGHTGGDTIMKHYAPSGEFTIQTAQTWMVAEGYAPQSTLAALSKLVKQGRVSRLATEGRYRFVNTVASMASGAK